LKAIEAKLMIVNGTLHYQALTFRLLYI